jgi:type IV secretory pathway VirB9-like protein
VTFHIIANQITTLFLSLHLLTTLSFDSEIVSFLYGGAKEDVFFQVTNNQKTLAIKPTQKDRFSNLLVITKNRKYYFDLAYDEASPHQFVEVKDGVMNHALKERLTHRDYQIMEGENSLLFINRRLNPVNINGVKVRSREYFSKGVPLIKEGQRILN